MLLGNHSYWVQWWIIMSAFGQSLRSCDLAFIRRWTTEIVVAPGWWGQVRSERVIATTSSGLTNRLLRSTGILQEEAWWSGEWKGARVSVTWEVCPGFHPYQVSSVWLFLQGSYLASTCAPSPPPSPLAHSSQFAIIEGGNCCSQVLAQKGSSSLPQQFFFFLYGVSSCVSVTAFQQIIVIFLKFRQSTTAVVSIKWCEARKL